MKRQSPRSALFCSYDYPPFLLVLLWQAPRGAYGCHRSIHSDPWLSQFALLIVLARPLAQSLCLSLPRLSRLVIPSSGQVRHFTLKPDVAVVATRIKDALSDGVMNGAAGLPPMFAVPETALGSEFFDVAECAGYGAFGAPHAKLTHAGRIDNHSAVWQEDQLSPHGCVTTSQVIGANIAGGLSVGTEQCIDQRRLSDTG